ncbi:RluA family pseudouridine synthase [Novisyntrophococcus fermenticellae]|uniref:RluA family pseudouridine synthase n=1 Tax=Novisyntrophococcus fermenticellae TaxID=2068655 RepID=UPI001E4A4E01|nr:RluA family pseudouridine synthase [Novisyntrophococcus fermenticellae]
MTESKLLILDVEPEHENLRIDKYLSEQLENLSRNYLQKLLKEGKVIVDGVTVKPNYRINQGEKIEISIPERQETKLEPEDIPLDILYEDKDLIVVNKPKGMVVHPAPGHYSHTLVNALMFHCKDNLSGINGVLRPGIVHRIDKDTTGVLVVCKNDAAHQSLSLQLSEHTITRRYHAIVIGNLKQEEGRIEGNIGRHPTDRKKMSTGVRNGKPAVTHYHVLKHLNGYTYVECRLETGRTHQIRVHMASIGHPLLGDDLYGPKKRAIPHLQGQTLHAMLLGFCHPRTGIYMEFGAPLPDYFEDLLLKLDYPDAYCTF